MNVRLLKTSLQGDHSCSISAYNHVQDILLLRYFGRHPVERLSLVFERPTYASNRIGSRLLEQQGSIDIVSLRRIRIPHPSTTLPYKHGKCISRAFSIELAPVDAKNRTRQIVSTNTPLILLSSNRKWEIICTIKISGRVSC